MKRAVPVNAKHAIEIRVMDRAWAGIAGARAISRRLAAAALAAPAPKGATSSTGPVELTILLADDATVQDLNRRFRGIDKPTNVLSFPAEDDAPRPAGAHAVLGDVAIAFETTRREAASEGISVADHLAHLVVHGVLHLRGYDHEHPADAEVMEALEVAILARHGIADPYAAGELVA
jgi:probable rRNA maturation factor